MKGMAEVSASGEVLWTAVSVRLRFPPLELCGGRLLLGIFDATRASSGMLKSPAGLTRRTSLSLGLPWKETRPRSSMKSGQQS